jgi:tRNA threonylcarbamoyladenosine biosynthesis protein TsaB
MFGRSHCRRAARRVNRHRETAVTSSPAPRLLILETSGRVGCVAVAEGEAVRAARRLDEARRHARDLAPAVADLLAGQGWRPRDLHGVVVSRGPGSYTGLRVGVMSAKALAYAAGCTVFAVDTFAAVAAQAPPEADRLDVLADAQQDKVYVQRFARSEEGIREQTPLRVRPFGEWLADLEAEVWASGPGLRNHVGRLPASTRVVDPGLWDPRVESLLRIGLDRYRAGWLDDPWTVEPLYLRPSSAEEKWREREGN